MSTTVTELCRSAGYAYAWNWIEKLVRLNCTFAVVLFGEVCES
ncbi:MAG: hypothetical protein ACYTXY_21865 [Nostoc sp.]